MHAMRLLRGPHRWLALLLATACLVALRPAPAIELPPRGFVWQPQLAPSGPVVLVISLPEQRAYVYRNGVRIGVSAVSTGRPGFETPTGVFTILEKRREHRSNLYDDAPMPFMQRLTWDGVALHAGSLPGYPASHGCVRLPYAFAERLFQTTARGMTVVIADATTAAPAARPGWFAPVAPGTGAVRPAPGVPGAVAWQPQLAPDGPVTVVLSLLDQELVVLRQGTEIGRAPVRWSGAPPQGTRAWVLLEGNGDGPSMVAPDRPARRWMALDVHEKRASGATPESDDIGAAVRDGRLQLPQAFIRDVYDLLAPGATVVVTGESLRGQAPADSQPLLEAERAPPVQAPPR